MNWITFLTTHLNLRKKETLWRKRNIIEKNKGRILIFNQKKYINFSNNDYLGLSHNNAIINAWKIGLNKYGVGSGSSGHIIGYTNAHAILEEQLSVWLGYPKALLFISGYTLNQSIIITLMNKHDYIFADRLTHASLLDGAILSAAKLKRFPHNQINTLEKFLKNNHNGKTLVITEGVFSMDGDTSPLLSLKIMTEKRKVWLLVDDAHGIGVIGNEGKGSCDFYKIKPQLLVITFGKAFGLSGAALLCDENIAEYFLQYGRHLIYSTSMPPAQAVALSEAIIQVRKADHLRKKLQRNIIYFRYLSAKYNFALLNSNTAIQPLVIGNNQRCLNLSLFLRHQGFWVHAVLPPTVPIGTARLRITITANHKLFDIEKLVKTLHEFFKNNPDE
ncbi:MAG: 8-amino-7-oxononanoate synthase [Arsenophonus sp.]|nr:MAG: 8-amino-7-oxononanoate synthase [Arsenophonus sp.]